MDFFTYKIRGSIAFVWLKLAIFAVHNLIKLFWGYSWRSSSFSTLLPMATVLIFEFTAMENNIDHREKQFRLFPLITVSIIKRYSGLQLSRNTYNFRHGIKFIIKELAKEKTQTLWNYVKKVQIKKIQILVEECKLWKFISKTKIYIFTFLVD